ncbi:MAG: GAF domain-containing protein [Chloroflexi bacterium]|nr:GAF domain-containing protein [Chloroflexota bacterium]
MEVDQVYATVAAALADLISYHRLAITSVGPQGDRVEYVSGLEVPSVKVGDILPKIRPASGAFVGESSNDIPSLADAFEHGGLLSWMRAPIGPETAPLGYISVRSKTPHAYSKRDLDLLERVASQLATAITNARLYAQAKREAEERTVLAEIGRIIGSSLELSHAYDRFAELVGTIVRFDRLIVMTHDDATLRIEHVTGKDLPGYEPGTQHPLKGTLSEWVMEHRQAANLGPDSPRGARGFLPSLATDWVAGYRSALCVPLVSQGQVIGTLNLRSLESSAYPPRAVAFVERVAAQVAPAIVNARLYAAVSMEAEERERRIRLEAERNELRRVNEAKSRFLTTVSHELKTPLTTMIAFAEVLARNRDQNLNDRQLRQLDLMRRNGRRLELLINDLLDISRIDAASFRLKLAEFDPRPLFDELVNSFEPLLATRHQHLDFRPLEDARWIEADRDRLAQVVSNLISNASKFSAERSQIELSLMRKDDRLYVTVKDPGVGISPEDQRRLFTAFFRADNEATRSVPGTGLGLYIAKSIIEFHRGKIWVESKPGSGTIVTFYIRGVLDEPSARHIAASASTVSLRSRLEGVPEAAS